MIANYGVHTINLKVLITHLGKPAEEQSIMLTKIVHYFIKSWWLFSKPHFLSNFGYLNQVFYEIFITIYIFAFP